MSEELDKLKETITLVREELKKVIVGQEEVIDHSLVAIIAGQHALIEGVPGIAKTLLVRTLARIMGCDFNRIQFTPDIMPADIIGTKVYNMKENDFVLHHGPVFTTFLLGDEINRAPAKTQSALLQAMQERTVTIDRETYDLSPNFVVFATQNPLEFEGTYPLPEAQKDRFMLRIKMDYPSSDDELEIASRMLGERTPENVLASGDVQQVITSEDLVSLKQAVNEVTIHEELLQYIVAIVRSTREYPAVLLGAGPRATQSLILASRLSAVLRGNDFVSPDDIRSFAYPVLEHRIVIRPEYEIEGVTESEIIAKIIDQVPVPR